MNANVPKSASLMGKMTAIFVVVLLAFSSFTLVASGSNEEQEQENNITEGITLGEALMSESQGKVEAISEANMAVPGMEMPVYTMADGAFSPARQDPGDAKVLLVDDDAENWMSGPWLEASHIATALNDGGYSYDVFRAGRWGGTSKELPSGDTGLSLVDDYEVVIWYSGWNTNILSGGEQAVLSDYLDGDCGSEDSFCTDNRNMFVSTQMSDWFDANAGSFQNNYMHSDTYYSSYIVVGGTSNPMKGVSGSIFEGKEYATDTAGVHYLDRPCGNKAFDNTATGAFWMDARKGAADGHEYHAVQFPIEGAIVAQTHKAFMFADEIGVFNKREDRADFFATVLSWMEVTKEQTQNVDIGIGGVDIPNHVQYWRSVEAMVEVDLRITVTNYGMLPQASTSVHLKLKNQFGQVLFDSTFDTRAFPEGHPMHIADSIQPGESVVFTFNKTNDAHQRAYDGLDTNKARAVIFTSAGMDRIVIEVTHTGDQGAPNNYVQADVGVGKWIENGEHPDDEIGPSITFGDEKAPSSHANSPSLDYYNYHRASSYDWDGDGCGWAEGVSEDCADNGGSLNKTVGSVYHEGKSSLASFAQNGWYKSNSDGDCSWELSDTGCPKFTPEPNQDDWFVSPPLDLSAMEEVVVGMLFTGCMESGDYFRMQISKDNGDSWTNLISYTGFCPGEGAWYLWGGSNSKYQGYVLGADWYGSDDTATVLWRVQMDADNDQNTEGSRPYVGWFIDEIVFRGTERITRDVAVGDVTVDKDFIVTNNHGNSLWREINATVINAGEASWDQLPVKFSVTNLQGEDVSGLIHTENENPQIATIPSLAGDSKYGDVTPGGGTEDQDELFALFQCMSANTYYATVEVLVPAGRDFFPWNNSLTVSFRVFDTFFFDDVDSDREPYSYTTVDRVSTTQNQWTMRDIGNDAYSGSYVWQYSNPSFGDDGGTSGGSDDSLITQDEFDRDGDTGDTFTTDVNVDLRAAFKPILSYAIKWDLGSGDRLEVRAATDFDSDQKLSSGTWTVLKTYEGNCGCSWSSSDDEQWIVEELELDAFEGFQTWFDFRVVTANGGGNGVRLDDLFVIGNEYRNNLDIVAVETERYAASGGMHDLSVTVKGIGLEPQTSVTVTAVMTDSNGLRVWPTAHSFNYFTLPVALAKGEEFTVDPNTAGSDWTWGSGLSPGIYQMRITAWRDDEQQVHDENPANNIKTLTIVLGAELLSGSQWTTGDGWSTGSYVWDGKDDGSLTSESFDVWNSKPFLVVEAEYDLTDAHVKAQVRAGSSGGWYDIKWRAADQLSTLYSIPGANYTQLPDRWSGSSSWDNATKQTFFADLGIVEQLSDGSGNLQDQYVRSSMQIRLTGTNTGSGDGGTFTAYYPAVFGLDGFSVDVKEISPTTQNAEPSSLSGDIVTRTYTVKMNNFGASSDAAVVDFVITAPVMPTPFVSLSDGNGGTTNAILDSIFQMDQNTVVAIKPVSGSWGGGRDDTSGGDQTAYISEGGVVTWPSGTQETGLLGDGVTSTGWKISNPTKFNWNSIEGKPNEPDASDMVGPGAVSTVSIDINLGSAAWVPPGAYGIQADARSWSDYDNTFTSGDSDGQATMIISKPDLSLGADVRYISHATGWGESGVGWVKKSGCNAATTGDNCVEDNYFHFMFEVLNSGTETVGSFKVGLLDFEGNPLAGVQVAIEWTTSGWAIDTARTTAEGAEIVVEGNKKYITFKATAEDLAMQAGSGDANSGAYTFYLGVDTEGTVPESNENNNRVPITITAVKEVNTVPSFSLSIMSMTLSGLLAAVGIALRQRKEE